LRKAFWPRSSRARSCRAGPVGEHEVAGVFCPEPVERSFALFSIAAARIGFPTRRASCRPIDKATFGAVVDRREQMVRAGRPLLLNELPHPAARGGRSWKGGHSPWAKRPTGFGSISRFLFGRPGEVLLAARDRANAACQNRGRRPLPNGETWPTSQGAPSPSSVVARRGAALPTVRLFRGEAPRTEPRAFEIVRRMPGHAPVAA